VDVEWRIGSTHDSDAKGPGFVSHPDPGWHFNGKTKPGTLGDRSKSMTIRFDSNANVEY
jgi:hypothetical protein